MSGHSHAANIKHDKEATDAKKGAAFSKIARLITVAVKENGGATDPDKNPRLKFALEKAKEVNLPKENMLRAIERGVGKGDAATLETVTYEGYGPAGVAIVLECITDNKFRTGAEIKNLFSQAGARLAEPGAASHFFQRKGLFRVVKQTEPQEQMLKLIDLGAEDIQEEAGFLSIYVPVEQLEEFKNKLISAQFNVTQAELVMKAKNKLVISPSEGEKVKKFYQKLTDHDDVQKVFVNVDL